MTNKNKLDKYKPPKSNLLRNKIFLASLLFTLILLVGLIALGAWTYYATLEESVPGMGFLRPVEDVQKVMSPEDGLVTEIKVRENDYVKEGQPLLILNTDIPEIEKTGLELQLQVLGEQMQALEAAYTNKNISEKSQLGSAWLQATKTNYLSSIEAAKMEVESAKYEYQKSLAELSKA